MEIQLALLDQIHFPTCMYIRIWATKKEEHAWMVVAKFDDFYSFDWNKIDLPIMKKIIYSF